MTKAITGTVEDHVESMQDLQDWWVCVPWPCKGRNISTCADMWDTCNVVQALMSPSGPANSQHDAHASIFRAAVRIVIVGRTCMPQCTMDRLPCRGNRIPTLLHDDPASAYPLCDCVSRASANLCSTAANTVSIDVADRQWIKSTAGPRERPMLFALRIFLIG